MSVYNFKMAKSLYCNNNNSQNSSLPKFSRSRWHKTLIKMSRICEQKSKEKLLILVQASFMIDLVFQYVIRY